MGTSKIICFALGNMLIASAWAGETTIMGNFPGPESPFCSDGKPFLRGLVLKHAASERRPDK